MPTETPPPRTALPPATAQPRAASPLTAAPRSAAALPPPELPHPTDDGLAAPVAEVVALYRNTTLDVRHLGQRRARSAAPWLTAGVVLGLAGSALFASDAVADWDGYAAAQAAAAASGSPAPAAPGTGLGALGAALILLGLVPFGVGLSRREDDAAPRYAIGEAHEADFHLAASGLADRPFPLVERDDGHIHLRVTDAMQGQVRAGGEVRDLADIRAEGRHMVEPGVHVVPLSANAAAYVSLGGADFRIRSVARAKLEVDRAALDRPFAYSQLSAAVVVFGFLGLTHLMPEDAMELDFDGDALPSRFVGYMQQPDVPPDDPEVDSDAEGAGETPDSPESARAPGPEGKMGDPSQAAAQGRFAAKRTASIPQLARTLGPPDARSAGILGIMPTMDASHFLASTAGSAFASGVDDQDIWGNLTGTDIGPGGGVPGGLGLVGTGRGGGGPADGVVGLGTTGLITGAGGCKVGESCDDRKGLRGTGFRERGRPQPIVRQAKADVIGEMDKDLIRRVVRTHINEVRFCYNQGLARDPGLRGRVAVRFTIGPTGTVPAAVVAESTITDRNVGNCAVQAVKRWRFPKPERGGNVVVTYPFVFEPG
jgi:TonB family protein